MKQKENIQCSFSKIPFKTTLSFEYLIEEIKKIGENSDHPMNHQANMVLGELKDSPELKGHSCEFEFVEQNRELINKLMAFVFNPLEDDITISSAGAPFIPKPIYNTSLHKKLILNDSIKIEPTADAGENSMFLAIIYQAYLIILKKFFDFKFDIDVPFNYKITNEKTGSIRYYKMIVNPKYVDVKSHGKIKKLSQEQMSKLFDNSENLDYWNKYVPLDKFEFSGFLKYSFVDITYDFVVSELKSILLDKDAIIQQENFELIKEKIKVLFEIPDLEIGLAAFSDFDSNVNQNVIWKSIVARSELSCHEYENTVYEKAYVERNVVLTDDLSKLEQNKMTSLFLQKGIKSHAIIPLILENEIVGMMEIGARKAGQINMYQIKRLHEVFPVFAIALKRSRDEFNDRIRAIIQQDFTSIHPTVEWRFREVAGNIFNNQVNGEKTPEEQIIFNDVVPIYGASDIRGSSIERNKGIQADLLEHLGMARHILNNCMTDTEMPLLDQLSFKVDHHLETVNDGLKAGDEVSIIEFLKREIDPVFRQLQQRDIAEKTMFDDYFNKMDPELHVIYKKRKDFEESLMKINDIVGEIVDEEELKAQEVFPHYFEKYRTDGVEYNAYIGQSLVKDLDYNEIYLKNIRLWQLLVKVKVARKIKEFQPELKTKLDITQLILVHSNPLSITFRQDEKKFDVAGAYNIRYEITKKRIDKAMIKGTNERVTQVGKIAIIYSHAEEIEEYKKYLEYLISKNYIKETIEDVELEDLKGASGLRALRVEVNFGEPAANGEIIMDEIKKVIEQI